MPALPLDEAGKYVAGAYVVLFMLVAVYVAIIAAKIARIDRELEALRDEPDRVAAGAPELVEDRGP
jgi:ABC-type branched-subunit amino acid transport system permease subunit